MTGSTNLDLSQLSLTEQLRALATGDVAPEEIWRACEARSPAARACNALTYEPLSSELAASRANAKDGPLAGAAIGVKDNIAVAGMPFTGGSPAFAGHVGTADAGAVAALREAGAIVSARLNLHELAFGITSNNPHYGQVLNPFDRTRMAGGSSGGSAVAVALG
ncbi:MAG: amidase, partial [Pseudomonadota bacterium]